MKLLTLIIAAFFLSVQYSYSQADTPQTAPSGQIPGVEPGDFPEYIIRPQEDLDPFGMTTLGGSTGEGSFREGAGTLNTRQTRPSNMEINRSVVDDIRERREMDADTNEETEIDYGTAFPASGSGDTGFTDVKPGVYRWTDEKGNIHFTNNLGSVPQKYMYQITDQLEAD